MPHSLPPLLRRTLLLPGESLESFLHRLAALNHYSDPGLLFNLFRQGRHIRPSDPYWFPRHVDTFRRLSDLTTLPVDQLKAATPHGFAPMLSPPDKLLPLHFPVATHLHARTEAQFCPRCLVEAPQPYHRLAWSLRIATACLAHDCLLHKGCPTCDSKLPVAAIVKAACPGCHIDLRETDAESLDEPGRMAQHVIQSWFGLTDAPDVTLPDLPIPALYKLTIDLARLLRPINPTWHFFPPGLTGLHRDTTTAIKALTGWPGGFHALLDAYRRRPGRPPSPAITHEFGRLYTYGLEKHWLDLAPVQQAFDDYVRQRSLNLPNLRRTRRYRDSVLQTTFISYAETMQRLNTTRRTVAHLFDLGLIGRDTAAAKTRRPQALLRRADVLVLQAEWDTPRPTADLARLLVTDEALVNALLAAGLLPEPTYAAVTRLLDNLLDATAGRSYPREAIPLSDAPDPAVALTAALAGQVRIYFSGGLRLDRLRLSESDLAKISP